MAITREEAIVQLSRYDSEHYTPQNRQAHRMAIAALQKLEKFRWIPVTEQLPKDSRQVLLYTSHGAVFRGYYDHVWNCWRTTKTVKITHWRLPDGPGDWE